MSDVIIAGIGQTPVGEHWELSLRQLAHQAIRQALAEAGGLKPQALYVGNMLAPQLSGQAHLGALLADNSGLVGIEAATIEAAGASGAAALRSGYMAVKSGWVDVALVVGVEKATDVVGPRLLAAQATSTDSEWESDHGMTPVAQAALLMRRYMYEFQAPRQAFAAFPLAAHANAVGNPNAMFQRAITAEMYQHAGLVSDPLNLFDAAPFADGAAALVLTRQEKLPQGFDLPLVRVAGSAGATSSLSLHDRSDPLDFEAARLSMQKACERAKIHPVQADFFELYDAYSIFTVLSLEAAGFAGRGMGWKLGESGEIQAGGGMPISTLGGLKARGNPGGAAGVYQAVDAVLQLRGQAGARQVPQARRALIQALGGPASVAFTHVLEAL